MSQIVFKAIEHKWLRISSVSCIRNYWQPPDKAVNVFLRELPNFGHYGIGLIRNRFFRVKYNDLFPSGVSIAYFTGLDRIGTKRLGRICFSKGHLSALFFCEHSEQLLHHYLSLGFYRTKGLTVFLGSGNPNDPVDTEYVRRAEELINSNNLGPYGRMFAFAHDADYFYDISIKEARS